MKCQTKNDIKLSRKHPSLFRQKLEQAMFFVSFKDVTNIYFNSAEKFLLSVAY